MIKIDSDTHFTPLDAFADLNPMYAEQGPRVVALPTGRHRIDYPARAPFVPAHINPLRVGGRPKSAIFTFRSARKIRRCRMWSNGWAARV